MDARILPLKEKLGFLHSLSEDDFRDQVIRPLFLRKGFTHGSDLCGPDEEGKDCYFTTPAAFGPDHIYVIQTKVGNLNLGREPSRNLMQAITQLRTALETKVKCLKSKQKRKPNFAFLCTTGSISNSAKDYIIDALDNPNIEFLDEDGLVVEVDKHYEEFWRGIKADRYPYLRNLAEKLVRENDFAALDALIDAGSVQSPISDRGYVSLKLSRAVLKPHKVRGEVTQEPEFEGISMEQILNCKTKRLWIVGDPGSGKSTMLKRIAELWCHRALVSDVGKIPVIVKAVDVAVASRSLADFLIASTESLTESGNSAFGADSLKSGKVAVLIDALDEIGSQARHEAFFSKLTAFETEYGESAIILTSRNYSYLRQSGGLSGYHRYNISPISYNDANKILQNVGSTKRIPVEKSRELLRQLENIHGFDLNPLVVTIFAASADSSRKDIPCNISELFAKFIETMLGRWDTQKGVSQLYESGLKQLLLQGIALRMHRTKEIRIPTEKFKRLVSEELALLGKEAKIDQLLDEILVRSGLLREVDGHTEFTHLLIQEYFAGKALTDEPNLGLFAIDEWWQRAIVFCCGSDPKNEARLMALKDERLAGDDRQLFTLAVTLGLAVQASYFVRVSPKCEIIDWVIQNLAKSTEPILNVTDPAQYPINTFLTAYLIARDAVAADCMESIDQVAPDFDAGSGEVLQVREFWTIVGLMESGHLQQAFTRVKKYHPKSPLLLLALHLGAYLIAHVRSAAKTDKAVAEQISRKLEPSIRPVLKSYFKEFKSQLLEWQKGSIKELPMLEESGDAVMGQTS